MERTIDINNLKIIVNKILDHLTEDLRVSQVTIRDDKDYYWDVPSDRRYAVNEPPPSKLDVGRLIDDWEFLESLLRSERDQSPSIMLIHVAPLLIYIGEEIGQ